MDALTEASIVNKGRPVSWAAVPGAEARGVLSPSLSDVASGGKTSSRLGGGRKSGRRGSSSEFSRIKALWRRASLGSDEYNVEHAKFQGKRSRIVKTDFDFQDLVFVANDLIAHRLWNLLLKLHA